MFQSLLGFLLLVAGCGSRQDMSAAAPRSADAETSAPAVEPPSEVDDEREATVEVDEPDVEAKEATPEAEDPVAEEEPKEPVTEESALAALPTGSKQLAVLCARPGQDKVRQVFCGPTPPTITSLVDLQTALGLDFANPTLTGRNNNGNGGNPAFALTGHSSSLVGKFTSAINPRVIVFTPPTGNPIPDYVALGFVRGEQFAEIVANDPDTNVAAFFLVRFEQACNATRSCAPGDLLTPAVEANWRALTIYEDHDIQNTIFDCKQCHQPAGEGTPKMLRMQELRNPWTHFFRDNTSGGPSLIADFQAAHGTTETYGGVPGALISSSDPANLEGLTRDNGFGNQPAEFPTRTIEREVAANGTSATWEALYARFVAGTVIAVPYRGVKVTDPAKLQKMTAAYTAFRNGAMPAAALPDIRNVLDDAELPYMGFGVKPGLDGKGILVQACTQCHNSQLRQDISRARFNVDLTKMSRAEKDVAINRLKLPANDPQRMPPARFRSLTDAEIELLVEELKK